MTTERTAAASPTKLRVIVADDHVVIRTGLARILESRALATVVASVGSGDDLVRVA